MWNKRFFILLGVVGLVAAFPAPAAVRTWTGTSSTNWSDAGNWGGSVPADGDAVVVPDTANSATMASANYPAAGSFLSFEIQPGAIVYCTGNTNAINVPSGGTVDSKHGTGVEINCRSALIEGTLSADWRGFPGSANGWSGPGGGLWGGSYGGMTMRNGGSPAKRYGLLTQPTALGSGDYNIMPGGGAIKMVVSNTLTVNGEICAEGRGNGSAAGSGGSVWLVCDQLAGTGTISVLGGSSPRVGENASGGGGRMSVQCQSNAFQGRLQVGGGCGPGPGYCISRYGGQAQPGTLWFPNWMVGREGTRENPTDLVLENAESAVRYWFPDSSVTQYWNVYITNSWLEVYGGSVAISNMHVTNGCFWANETVITNMELYGSIYFSNTIAYLPQNGTYSMAGDFVMADTSTVVYTICDTNIINADSGGVDTNKHGGGVWIRCRNALVEGRIDAYRQGFIGPIPKGGPGCYGAVLGGGGHGGTGGGWYNSVRRCYGSVTRPTSLGSSGYHTSIGGGAVRFTATDTLTLNGAINVNGLWSSSGGSGGSVWLQVGTFAGNGFITAEGADAKFTVDNRYGGGGGGRVAVEYGTWNYTGDISVRGGTNGVGAWPEGITGTVFLCQSQWLGTTTTNGVNGRQLDTDFSISSNNLRVARSITRFDTSMKWSDESTDTSGATVVTNVAVYTISGLPFNREYAVYLDGAPMFGSAIETSTNGVLVFTNTLDMAHEYYVMPWARGTLIRFR